MSLIFYFKQTRSEVLSFCVSHEISSIEPHNVSHVGLIRGTCYLELLRGGLEVVIAQRSSRQAHTEDYVIYTSG